MSKIVGNMLILLSMTGFKNSRRLQKNSVAKSESILTCSSFSLRSTGHVHVFASCQFLLVHSVFCMLRVIVYNALVLVIQPSSR